MVVLVIQHNVATCSDILHTAVCTCDVSDQWRAGAGHQVSDIKHWPFAGQLLIAAAE